MLTLFVVSDATGDTAQRMIRATLVQFKNAEVHFVRRANVRSLKEVRDVVREAAAAGSESLIIHTLVSDELRQQLRAESRQCGVDSLDLMGPILERLATHLKVKPEESPGLFQDIADARTREIEAVSFAFKHDDGQNAQDLSRAEVVLIGISRVMKTPTMLYLAYRGWFAANIPLVLGVAPPDELLRVPADRVFCLIASPERLQQLRLVRAERESIPVRSYASLEQIHAELSYVDQLCRRYQWQRINATGKSVEEVSREIIGWLSD